jgi:endo-alpha-1,4-polygalactosaminidase (GH114 family)
VCAVLGAALATAPSHGSPRLERARTFAFALGDGALRGDYLRRFGPYDLVVVDGAETRSVQVRALRARGKVVLGYLSVGTVERGRSWFRSARRYRLDLWGDWGEWYADTSRAGFRRLVARRVAPRILRKGFDGLFLDNVDMIAAHRRQRRGMRRLVAALGRLAHRRGGFLFAQNGEDVIGPMLRHLDGWNREDVSRTYSFRRRRYVPVSPADHRVALRALRRIRGRGVVVTATDYVRRGDAGAARAATAAACGAGALSYVSDIGLSRVPQPPARCD